MAAGEGFEPSHTESESAVLPLHNPAKRKSYYTEKTLFVKNFFPRFAAPFPCRDGRGRRGERPCLFDREQAHAVHAVNALERGDERADAARHAADVDRKRDARLAEHGQALRDGQDVRARAEKT